MKQGALGVVVLSCPCGNRALNCSCPDCPYVSKTSKVKENEKHKQETVLEARERLQATYDSHVDKEGVRAAIQLHPPYEDARAEGVYDFAEQSMEFCHVLPADTVNKVIAWGHNLDPKYAVLTITSKIRLLAYGSSWPQSRTWTISSLSANRDTDAKNYVGSSCLRAMGPSLQSCQQPQLTTST